VPIPYLAQPQLGPIHGFGVLVAGAILVGTHVLRRRAAHDGLDADLASRIAGWVVIGGFVGAHLIDGLFYEPDALWTLSGISSFGGFLGAIVGFVACMQWIPPGTRWRYADAIAYAFVMAWILGRAGCTIAFDHPGDASDGLLAWRDHAGVARHNLGFYEMLYFVGLAALFHLLGRRARRFGPGFFVGLLAVLYAPVRFALDLLRTGDARPGGLTPAQWGCFAVIAVGLAVLARARRLGPVPAAA
jgi:phosphatidylglycerol---prolipoprotein diacylglyceryl transferase